MIRYGAREKAPNEILCPYRGNHGWENIPYVPHQKAGRYEASFALASREDDYRIAWPFFLQDQDANTEKSPS